MSAPPCVYRDFSDEAYVLGLSANAKLERIEVSLCSWPTTMGLRPRWVDRRIGSGLRIDPETDCPSCPVRKSFQETDEPTAPLTD